MRQIDYLFAKTKYSLVAESNQLMLRYLWWILTPILDAAVFYIVFGLVFASAKENFISFLWIGTVLWSWVSVSVSNASNAILSAKGLIAEVYVPKFHFPLVVLLTDLTKQLCVFAMLGGGLLLLGNEPSIRWALMIPLIGLTFGLIASVSIFLALLVPIFPDLRFLISSALQLLMFCSGIFYDISVLSDSLQKYFLMNPVAIIIYQARDILLHDGALQADFISYILLITSLLLILSALLHFLLDRRYTTFLR